MAPCSTSQAWNSPSALPRGTDPRPSSVCPHRTSKGIFSLTCLNLHSLSSLNWQLLQNSSLLRFLYLSKGQHHPSSQPFRIKIQGSSMMSLFLSSSRAKQLATPGSSTSRIQPPPSSSTASFGSLTSMSWLETPAPLFFRLPGLCVARPQKRSQSDGFTPYSKPSRGSQNLLQAPCDLSLTLLQPQFLSHLSWVVFRSKHIKLGQALGLFH